MNTIFLAFANSRTHPLPTLKEEDERVYHLLTHYQQKHPIKIHRDSFATTHTIAQYLITHQKQLSLFLFSGHAGKDALYLEDEAANSQGIAALLGACPNLKAVVLNGCATKGQVEGLLNQGVPIVIATNAPVEDRSATQFSTAFFQQLTEQDSSIEEAFEIGIGSAKLSQPNELVVQRGLVTKRKQNQPTWGIHYNNKDFLQLKLRERIEKVRPPKRPKCFLMYDFEDVKKVQKLKKFLYLLERNKEIEIFDMHATDFAENQEQTIDYQINQADWVLCLITFNFLFSTYDWALKARNLGKRIIPIQVNVVGWEDTFFPKLRSLPSNKKAIAEWSNEDAAYTDIVTHLRKILK